MECVEAKIGNARQPMFDDIEPDREYYIYFGDSDDTEKNLLPYGEEIKDQKDVEVNEAYIEALYIYIGAKVVIPGIDYIPVIAQVKYRKRDALGKPIGEEHSNTILDTRIYEL